jgi:hypothetical protein
MTGWVFYLVKLILELSLQKQQPLAFEILCDFLGSLNPLLNGIVLYIWDAKVVDCIP